MADPRWGTAPPGLALRPDPWWLRAIPPDLRVVCAVWLACLVLWIVPLATVGKDSPESFFGSWVGVVYLYYLTLSLIGLGMLLGLGALVGRVLAPALPPA
ncbi:MAG TPA: hypothetical protein VNR62_00225 [Cellulomonas sp.]|nr:hypothetical protein [Cellulomonas sp.]